MDNICVSIIVPVYKTDAALLRRCVGSLLAQQLAEIEILLVDDGCPNGSGTLCDEFALSDPRVRVFHKPNGGVSTARNTGLDNARGEYVLFVDSDDFADPALCSSLYRAARESGADITACGADRYDPSADRFCPFVSTVGAVYRDEQDMRRMALSLMRTMRLNADDLHLPINHYVWAHLYRRDWLGELRFHPALRSGQDKYFNLFALLRCRVFCQTPGALYHYVFNGESMTNTFRALAIERSLEAFRLYRQVPEVESDPEFRNAFYIRTCCMSIAQIRSHFFHPDNPDEEPMTAFRAFCREELVAEAFRRADIRTMRLSKMKLVILCLKLRLYRIAARLACRFRL